MTFPNTQSVAAMVRLQSSSNDNSHSHNNSIQDFESSAALASAMSGHQGNAARASSSSSSSFMMGMNGMNMGMNTGGTCGTRAAASLKPNSRLAESLTSLTDIDFLIGALEPSCSSANAGTAGMASNARTGNNNAAAAGLASRRNSLAWMMPLAAQQQPHNNTNNSGDAAAQVLTNQANNATNAAAPAVPSSAEADVTAIAETVLSEIDDDLFKEDLFPLLPSAPIQAAGASGVQAASASSSSSSGTETLLLSGTASNNGNAMDGSSAGLRHQFDSDLFEPTPIERMNRYLPQVPTSFMVGHHQHGSTTNSGNGQHGGAFAQQQLPSWLNAPTQNFMFSGFSANNANPGMNMNMNMDMNMNMSMLTNMDASSMGNHGRVSSSSPNGRSPLKRSAPDDAAAMISDAAANSSGAGASSTKRQRRCVSPSSSHASAASASMHANHVLPTVAHSSAGAAATRAPPTPVTPPSSGPSNQQHRPQQRKEADLLQTGDQSDSARFRGYQEDQWNEKFEELCAYMNSNGHTQVPHRKESSKESLSRWCKRQRYQYKLLQENKPSTMTLERIRQLESIHFVWDSHGAIWEERLQELKEYRSIHGHCSIPSNYSKNQKLATWVKCQRRQRKLFCAGKKSNMTLERSQRLDALGFIWELRCHGGGK